MQWFREYVDEMIYGANDGIITTFAVVAGATGAALGEATIIILGLANLFADGFSMGASSFLASITKRDVADASGLNGTLNSPKRESLATFLAFVAAGALPLLPFLFGGTSSDLFFISALIAALAFFIIGGLRSIVTKKSFTRSGLQMLAIGGIAALIAYSVGYGIEAIVR